MSTDALTAFGILLEELSREKERLADMLREATIQGHFEEAQHLLVVTQGVEQITQKIRALRDEWTSLEKARVSGTAEYARVGYTAKDREKVLTVATDEESPEQRMAERIFGREPKRRRSQRAPVERTPRREFRLPILEALEQLGGKGPMAEVLSIVYDKLRHRLTEADLKRLPSGGDIRWRNTAQWERKSMVIEGLLRDDSPHGVWEISDAGREYLKRMRQGVKGESLP